MSTIMDRLVGAVREYDPTGDATGLRVHFTDQVRRRLSEQEGWDPLRIELAAPADPQPGWAWRAAITVVLDERVPENTMLLRDADGRVVAVMDVT